MQPTAPAADAVWSRYGDKRHLVFVLVGVLVFAGLTALGYNGFANGSFDTGVAQVIGGIITGFFALGLVLCVVAAALFPSRRHRLPGVAIDAAGIWWHRDRQVTLVPWPAIAGVGIGYLKAPTAAVASGASLGQHKNQALDVFLRTQPMPAPLHTWSATEPPPVPSLPADRLRFTLPTAGDRHAIAAAVAARAPALWLGEYERQWTPLGMLET